MATVSVRVPDELKERMDEHPTVNWSAVLREQIAAELEAMESRDLARAVLVSERLSNSVDLADARAADAAGTVHEWRKGRYGPGGDRDGGASAGRDGGPGGERDG